MVQITQAREEFVMLLSGVLHHTKPEFTGDVDTVENLIHHFDIPSDQAPMDLAKAGTYEEITVEIPLKTHMGFIHLLSRFMKAVEVKDDEQEMQLSLHLTLPWFHSVMEENEKRDTIGDHRKNRFQNPPEGFELN